jgi:hypothetical protein
MVRSHSAAPRNALRARRSLRSEVSTSDWNGLSRVDRIVIASRRNLGIIDFVRTGGSSHRSR